MNTRLKFLSAVFILFSSVSFAQLPGYSWYKILTIQSSQVMGPGNLTDLPVLISHTDPDLRTVTQGGQVKIANGWDIKFTAADGVTPIDHQVEKYDSTTGQIVAWVRVPTVASAANTDIYIYYGNAAIGTDPSVTTTWDANVVSDWHLHADEKDYTASAFHLTNNGTTNTATGIAAAGQNFTGGQFLSRGITNNLMINGDLTIEAFVNLSSLQGSVNDNFIIANGDLGESSTANYLYSLSIDPTGNLRMFWESGSGTDEIVVSTAPCTITPGTWSQISVVRDASSKLVYFYQNGNQIGAAVSYTNNANGGSTNTLQIGSDQNTSTNDLDGSLDEIRISNAMRSPEWVKTNYNSISSPSTFYTMGAAFNTCTAPPSPAVGGPDQNLCGASTATLAATNPATGNGVWAMISGFGTITSPTSFNSTITGLGFGPTVLYWKTSNQTCAPSYDTVVIDNNIVPSAAVAGSDFGICSSSGNLAATTPTAGLGTWTVFSGPATIATANSPATVISGITSAQTIFVWTVSSGVCTPNSDTVVVTLDVIPTTSAAGPDQLTCNDTLTLAANTPVIGTGSWSVFAGTGIVTTGNSPTSTITGAGSGTNIFVWNIVNGSCPVSSDTIVISVDTLPTTAVVGANQNICSASALITSNTPTVGTGVWSLASGSGNITFPNSTSTTVSAIGAGTSAFVWTISHGTCPASTDTLVITRSPFPTTSNAGTD
ncbi:MAG: DUF2341 domain-containing protein, partial [Bacteroidia bacterium]|nr:DUF2341 domain-containing protein [Bacteroidia bacterium]